MANIVDPIESMVNSVLAPLTSVASETTQAHTDAPSRSSTSNTVAISISLTATMSTSSPASSATTISKSTIATKKSTSSISTIAAVSTSDSNSTTSTDPSTTSASLFISSSLSIPAAPTAAATIDNPVNSTPSATSTPQPISSPSGDQVSVAGIVVAIIFAIGLSTSILWLVFRYCAPIRKRYDAWSEKRKHNRSWREGLYDAQEKYRSTSSGEADRPFSFLALNRASYRLHDLEAASAHKQTQSRIQSTSSLAHSDNHRSKCFGLGLGCVSMLRHHSSPRKAGHNATPVYRYDTRAETPLPNTRMKALPIAPRQSLVPMPLHTRRLNGSMGSLPKLHVHIPEAPSTRVSQIGIAVTSITPDPGRDR